MSIMKYCVILGCFTLCIWAQTSQAVFQDKAFKEHFAKCAEELKLTKDDIEKLKKKENLTDERYKCLGKCVGEKEGLIKDGMYNKEGAKKIAMNVFKDNPDHLKKAEEVAEECEQKLKKNPTTGCEVGPAVLGCLIEGAKAKKEICLSGNVYATANLLPTNIITVKDYNARDKTKLDKTTIKKHHRP